MILLWYCIQTFAVIIQNRETKENLMGRRFQASVLSFHGTTVTMESMIWKGWFQSKNPATRL